MYSNFKEGAWFWSKYSSEMMEEIQKIMPENSHNVIYFPWNENKQEYNNLYSYTMTSGAVSEMEI